MSKLDVLSVPPEQVLAALTDLGVRRQRLAQSPKRTRGASRGRGAAAERAALSELLLWLDGDQRLAPGVDLPSLSAICDAAGAIEGTLLTTAAFSARAAAAAEVLGDVLDAAHGLVEGALQARRGDPSLTAEQAAALDLDLRSLSAPIEEAARRGRRRAHAAQVSARRTRKG